MSSNNENTDCPFCGSIEDQRTIERTALSYVFLSNPSMTKGHTLVVPKRHVWAPWDITEEELLDMNRLLNKYRRKLELVIGPGSDIRQQYRPFLPNGPVHNLRHFHYHILPRQLKDSINESEVHISRLLNDQEMQEVSDQLQ